MRRTYTYDLSFFLSCVNIISNDDKICMFTAPRVNSGLPLLTVKLLMWLSCDGVDVTVCHLSGGLICVFVCL